MQNGGSLRFTTTAEMSAEVVPPEVVGPPVVPRRDWVASTGGHGTKVFAEHNVASCYQQYYVENKDTGTSQLASCDMRDI